jgi:ATP-dependent Lon protease
MHPEFFTNNFGLITDYMAEYMREMRKRNFANAIDQYFKLGNNLNQRDVIAVRRTVSGLLKLLHPNNQFDKEEVRYCLVYALEVRRHIKEQLKKLGGMFGDLADTTQVTFKIIKTDPYRFFSRDMRTET